jgi:hypothetical protein
MAGDRQHVCGNPDCQRERHRLNCAKWRKDSQNRDYDRETRLETHLVQVETGTGTVASVDPLEAIDWSYARKVVGLEVTVLVQEVAKVVLRKARDSVPR